MGGKADLCCWQDYWIRRLKKKEANVWHIYNTAHSLCRLKLPLVLSGKKFLLTKVARGTRRVNTRKSFDKACILESSETQAAGMEEKLTAHRPEEDISVLKGYYKKHHNTLSGCGSDRAQALQESERWANCKRQIWRSTQKLSNYHSSHTVTQSGHTCT